MKGIKGQLRACIEYGKRAKVLEVTIYGPLCVTQEGEVYHLKTGLRAHPPGVEIGDPRRYVAYLLENADPHVFADLDKLGWGHRPPRYLIEGLLETARRYREPARHSVKTKTLQPAQ